MRQENQEDAQDLPQEKLKVVVSEYRL